MNQTSYLYSEDRPWGKFYIIQESSDYKKLKGLRLTLVIDYLINTITKDQSFG